jgi:hypothetical protein
MAQIAVPPGPIVKDSDVIEGVGPGQIPGFIDAFADSFLFRLLKNDSATALSQQFLRRLMLGCRLLARQKRCQSSLPY